MIVIDKVFLKFDSGKKQNYIFENLNLNIQQGEFVCLLGPSGCGKSSLLALLAGFIKPTQGQIIVSGSIVTRPCIKRSLVFQEYALFSWLNVIDNVAFGLKSIKNREERLLIASKYLEMVGLIEHAKDSVENLSGGMKQRVAIARALAVRPDLLLMDEPFGALDEKTRLDMQKELINIWQDLKTTIIFVTHSLDEALLMADRILVMIKNSSGKAEIKDNIVINEARPRSFGNLSEYKEKIINLIYSNQLMLGADI